MQASEPKDLNPYVAVVAKKHRNLKKKLERVAKAEQLLAQGKVLDEEQRILLSSKKAIEKSVTELLNIKQMLEEVAKSEDAAKTTGASEPSPVADLQDEPEVVAHDAATFTESAEQFPAATNTEVDEFDAPEPQVDLKEKFNEFIERLIKALHVYERYTNVTSHPLPDTVMYFGRTLLGLTSISSFQDTLNNSIRVAGFFLHDDEANNNDVIRGTSYAKLAAEIDVLVEEMERAQQHGSTNALTALLRTTIAPVSPTNTPAAVESVPTYDTGLYGSLLGEQSLGTFNQFQFTTPAPVFQAAEPVFQAPVADSRSAVPIAPTLPEYEGAIVEEPEDEPSEEEETGHEEPEEETVHIEEIIDEVVPAEEVVAEEAATVSAAEEAHKNRMNKNVRVRGDPSRAVRKAEDAKKHAARSSGTHHYEVATASSTHHHEPAQKTFRDRLLSSQSLTAAPAPAAAPVEAAHEAPAPAEEAADKRKRTPRTTSKKDDTAPEAAATVTAAAGDKTKKDRNIRVRSRRSEGEAAATEGAAADIGKKWSAIAANAIAAGEGAPSETAAAEKKLRKTSPKGERPARTSGDKPVARPRREKKEEAPAAEAHDVPAAPHSTDGFQAVSRRTAPSAGASVKKDGDKKTAASTRGDIAPVKKHVVSTASK